MTFDPAMRCVEVRLELNHSGVRQTIDIRLPDEDALEKLKNQVLDPEIAMETILLYNGEELILNLASVWYLYRLGASQTWSRETLRLGGV